MSWLELIGGSDAVWRAVTYGIGMIGTVVGIIVIASLSQFLTGDVTMQLVKSLQHSADIYCSMSEFDRYALKRIIEDNIAPHRVQIEC